MKFSLKFQVDLLFSNQGSVSPLFLWFQNALFGCDGFGFTLSGPSLQSIVQAESQENQKWDVGRWEESRLRDGREAKKTNQNIAVNTFWKYKGALFRAESNDRNVFFSFFKWFGCRGLISRGSNFKQISDIFEGIFFNSVLFSVLFLGWCHIMTERWWWQLKDDPYVHSENWGNDPT